MLGVLFSKTDTPFGSWLHDRGAFGVYSRAYLLVTILAGISLLGLVVCKANRFHFSGVIGLWFLTYATINGYTLVRNTFDLIMLNMEFNRRLRK